jgi:NitT/TauT family transport system substrate-binding protein
LEARAFSRPEDQMDKRSVLAFFVALLSLVLLAMPHEPVHAAALTTIHFTSSSSDDLRPLLYAQSAGLFQKAGLNVVIDKASSGGVVAQSVIGGAMDIGKASLSSLVAAHARGVPFVLIAPSAIHRKDDANSGVMVAANSPIKSVLDLQGKVVGCTAIGDIGYLGLRAMIDAQGGDSATVKWVEIPTSALSATVEQNRVDAGLTTEPYMTKDLATGKFRILVDMLNGYPHPILESAYFAKRDYVEANRGTVARFAKVLQQAAAYADNHVPETLPLLISFTGLDTDVAEKMHKTYTPLSFEPQQIQPVIDLAAKYQIIPKGFAAADMLATGSSH